MLLQPYRLNEIKEFASFDKDEQSLIKLSIEISEIGNEYNYQYRDYRQATNYSYYNTRTFGLFDNCKNKFKPTKYNTNTNKNFEILYEPYSQYSHPQTKNRNFDEYKYRNKNSKDIKYRN